MAMKCPNCGNDLNPEEVFCGQCGTPNLPTAKPTEMVNTPPSRHGLLSGGYHTAASPPPGTGTLPQPDSRPVTRPPGPQQGFAGTPMPGGYPTYGPPAQPFQTGNYSGTLYPPTQQSFPTG